MAARYYKEGRGEAGEVWGRRGRLAIFFSGCCFGREMRISKL